MHCCLCLSFDVWCEVHNSCSSTVYPCSYAGGNLKEVPHPDVDWAHFVSYVKSMNNSTPTIFDCLTGKHKHWIDMDKLNSFYGNGQSSTTCTIM